MDVVWGRLRCPGTSTHNDVFTFRAHCVLALSWCSSRNGVGFAQIVHLCCPGTSTHDDVFTMPAHCALALSWCFYTDVFYHACTLCACAVLILLYTMMSLPSVHIVCLRCPVSSTPDDAFILRAHCALTLSWSPLHGFPLNQPKVGRNPLNTPNHISILTTGTSSNYCVLVASRPRSAILQNKIRAKRKEHPFA